MTFETDYIHSDSESGRFGTPNLVGKGPFPLPVFIHYCIVPCVQALLQRDEARGAQPYERPNYFPARICGLLTIMVLSWLIMSLSMMVLPVWFGRQVRK